MRYKWGAVMGSGRGAVGSATVHWWRRNRAAGALGQGLLAQPSINTAAVAGPASSKPESRGRRVAVAAAVASGGGGGGVHACSPLLGGTKELTTCLRPRRAPPSACKAGEPGVGG